MEMHTFTKIDRGKHLKVGSSRYIIGLSDPHSTNTNIELSEQSQSESLSLARALIFNTLLLVLLGNR
jgi:hypothetical protein